MQGKLLDTNYIQFVRKYLFSHTQLKTLQIQSNHHSVMSQKGYKMGLSQLQWHMQNSSIHGLAQASNKELSLPKRLFWLVILIAALVYAGFMLNSSFQGTISGDSQFQ